MSENIISWNVANWVTVVLMALLGYFILTLVVKTISHTQKGEVNA